MFPVNENGGWIVPDRTVLPLGLGLIPPYSKLGNGCRIPMYTKFGHHCQSGWGCCFESWCKFGDGCVFGRQCEFENSCRFGTDCRFRSSCMFGTDCRFRPKCKFADCRFGSNCRFKENCEFASGCVIGHSAHFGDCIKIAQGCQIGPSTKPSRGLQYADEQVLDWVILGNVAGSAQILALRTPAGCMVSVEKFFGPLEAFMVKAEKEGRVHWMKVGNMLKEYW